MKGLLFGFLPVLPLPGSFALAHPELVTVHMIVSFSGVVMLCAAIFLLATSLLLYVISSSYRESLKWGGWILLWGLGFSILGLYIFLFILLFIGAIGYRQYS